MTSLLVLLLLLLHRWPSEIYPLYLSQSLFAAISLKLSRLFVRPSSSPPPSSSYSSYSLWTAFDPAWFFCWKSSFCISTCCLRFCLLLTSSLSLSLFLLAVQTEYSSTSLSSSAVFDCFLLCSICFDLKFLSSIASSSSSFSSFHYCHYHHSYLRLFFKKLTVTKQPRNSPVVETPVEHNFSSPANTFTSFAIRVQPHAVDQTFYWLLIASRYQSNATLVLLINLFWPLVQKENHFKLIV